MAQTTLALIVFLFPLAYSPGPGNMFFAANAARFGFRATIPANLGYHVATWIVTAAIGLGLVNMLDGYPRAFMALKIAGALYVLWLAWKMFTAGAMTGTGAARPARFADGAILLLLNPKAYVIIALMFTQFLGRRGTGGAAEALFITTVFTLNNLIAFLAWIAIGDRIARGFRTPASARRLNMTFGAILAGVSVWMLLS